MAFKPPSRRHPIKALEALLIATAALALMMTAGVTQAQAAVVGANPTWPIPEDAPAGPPPISALPGASDSPPPSDQIADPVTAGTSCVDWYQQHNYGDRWSAASTWWEYRCTYENDISYDPCSGGTGACNGCSPDCTWETQVWTDYFYWDGANAVFYGESYSDAAESANFYFAPYSWTDWWDAPAAQWYLLGPYNLTVFTAGPGSGSVAWSPAGISCTYCSASFDAGTQVTVTATPDPGWRFTGWAGDCTGTGTCQVTMNQAHYVTANFGPETFDLSVARQGSGSGQVTSSPAGIICGTTCQVSLDPGAVVTLTASPDTGSIFTGWSGDCSGTGTCQVIMNPAHSVTANFAAETFDLSVATQGSGSGQVTSSPAGIACGATCQASFAPATAVTLTASPDAGSIFTGWAGDCTGTGACQVTMNQARSVIANFRPNTPPQASFTLSCTALICTFDGSGSADSDGNIAAYIWDFGDGSHGSGPTFSHTYARPGNYTATLTVTDNSAASTSTLMAVSPITLAARGYKQNGLQKVQLSWSGASGASFDIYRNSTGIATVQANTYTDNLNNKGPGAYTYQVCEAGIPVCSNTATVSFRSAVV
jgi:PKD repeat protein